MSHLGDVLPSVVPGFWQGALLKEDALLLAWAGVRCSEWRWCGLVAVLGAWLVYSVVKERVRPTARPGGLLASDTARRGAVRRENRHRECTPPGRFVK